MHQSFATLRCFLFLHNSSHRTMSHHPLDSVARSIGSTSSAYHQHQRRSSGYNASSSSMQPRSTSMSLPSSSSTSTPTVVLPREWKVPKYLELSAFHDRFVVGQWPSLESSLASSSTSSRISKTSVNSKGKERERAEELAIPLPYKLDPYHCCKRLLISQDYGLQYLPERDDQGKEST